MVSEPGDVITLARGMGIIGLPASVKTDATEVATSSTGTSISASWTLTLIGANGQQLAIQKQTATFAMVNVTGGQRLHVVDGGPPVRISLQSLYPTPGSSEAAARAVADDVSAGNQWIPGFTVAVTSSTEEVHADPIVTIDPDRTVEYKTYVSAEQPGERTTWTVADSAADFTDTVTAATTLTVAPTAEHSIVGAIKLGVDTRSAVKQAADAALARIRAQDAAGLAAMTIGEARLAPPLLHAFKTAPPRVTSASAIRFHDESDGAVATDGDLAFVHKAGGWELDPSRSQLSAWTAAGTMARARSGHSATLLDDGRVLVAGGTSVAFAGGTSPTSTAEIYDSATGKWTAARSMNHPRFEHSATLLADGRVLVAGGLSSSGTTRATSSAEIFDPGTGRWTPVAAMKVPRWVHSATLLSDGRVLVAGGLSTTETPVASSEVYDPKTNTWKLTAPMHARRGQFPAVLLTTGEVLVVGGFGKDGSPIDSSEIYNVSRGTWKPIGVMSRRRGGHAAIRLRDGRVLVISGEDTLSERIAAVEIGGSGGGWGFVGSVAEARFAPSAALLSDGRVLCAAGFGGTQPISSAEIFDPKTLAWSPADGLTTARYAAPTVVLPDGRVLVIGGLGRENKRLASAEIFTYWPKD
jgi:hypothetical protein